MRKFQTIMKGDWRIAVLLSAFLPLFNIIVVSQHRPGMSIEKIITNASITFCFLMFSWYCNAGLTELFRTRQQLKSRVKRLFLVLISNAILLAMFVTIAVWGFREAGSPGEVGSRSLGLSLIVLKATVSIGLIYLVQFAINSNRRTQQILLQNEQLKTENLRSQFEILRQQVNPHFLFNSLSTLRNMVRSGDENSEEFVLKLSEIYRQLLLKREKDTVTLKEELDFVSDYSFMLKSRFRENLKITIAVDGAHLAFRLPTFSLQLLLENCVKHNVISSDKPLEITVFTSAGFVTVENRQQAKITKVEHSGYGIPNLVERYKLLGEADAVFVYQDAEVFRVRLNLLQP